MTAPAVKVHRPAAPVRLELPRDIFLPLVGPTLMADLPEETARRLLADLLLELVPDRRDTVLLVGGPRHGDLLAVHPSLGHYLVVAEAPKVSAWERLPDGRQHAPVTYRQGRYDLRTGRWMGWDR